MRATKRKRGVPPDRLGCEHRPERRPVGDEGRCARAHIAREEDDDDGDDERVQRDGKDPAQSDFERRGELPFISAEEVSHKIGTHGGNERHRGSDRQVERQHGRGEVGEDAAHIERRDRLRKEEGENGERLARADLEPSVCERHKGVGQRHVQRGDHARAADALCGKKVFEHEKTSVFLFGSVDRKPSVSGIFYHVFCMPSSDFNGARAWGGRRSARRGATARPRPPA